METSEILTKLENSNVKAEKSQSQDVKQITVSILKNASVTEGILLDILTKVIKPLFSKQQHPNLTATGRKKLVPDAPIASRLINPIDWNDEKKAWKNGWTYDLLLFILSQYPTLPLVQEKSTFEAQFHLLVPPILNLIDDSEIESRIQGCELLRLLCDDAIHCHSDILKRTGLSEVFSDALRPNFLSLPTLTPEDDSLALLSKLYPAFRALVDARSPGTSADQLDPEKLGKSSSSATNLTAALRSNVTPTPLNTMSKESKEKNAHQEMLDVILRQGILASYAHASDYIRITTFLLHEANLIISMMGIYSAKYLQILLPLLRKVMCDPFGTAYVPLLMESVECMEVLICVCWPRIQEKWWTECLRGAVGCWVRIDDEEDEKRIENDFAKLRTKLREIVRLLEVVVGDEFESGKRKLLEEDESLEALFRH